MPLCPATPRTFLLAAATLAASAAFPCAHTVDGSYCWNPAVHGSYFGSVEGDVSASNAKGSFEGAVVGIPAADPGGVFAPAYSSRVDRRMTTARTLLIYVHELGTPDMYSASANGQLGATTRYDYLNKMANEERQWYAANSGGKMDATYTIVDSGEIGYRKGTTPWRHPFEIVAPLLIKKGLKRSDYDFVQLVWDDMQSGTYVQFEKRAGGESNQTILWAGRNSVYHEIGHNLYFNHANDLSNTSLNASLYDYDFVTKRYVPGSSTENSKDAEIKPLTVGVIRNDYGSPVDLMGGGNRGNQYGAQDKQQAGWLTSKQIGTITPGADGSVSNIAIHNPEALVVVTDGNVLPGQEGSTGRYGVERGYSDVPYAATFVRKGQSFRPNVAGDGGKWETYVQVIDLNHRQITPNSVGIELRVDGAYLGVIQKGQKISEKDFAQFNYVQFASPWGSGVKNYDLVKDLNASAPDNPNRYRSTWYDIEYTDTGADSVGDFANLRITHHAGSTPVGRLWAGGSGDWDTTTAGWLDLDNGNVTGVWTDGLDATFGTPVVAAGTVTVSGEVSPASLTFKPAASGVYSLSGGTVKLGAGGLNAEASANIASNLDFADQQVWEIIAGKTVSVTGTITDNSNSLEKIGLGELALNASQSLRSINIYEGVVSQGATQTLASVNIYGHGEYVVKGGTLILENTGKITRERGFPSALRLARTDSTTASPELEFLGNGWITADLVLDAGQHVIRTTTNFPIISGAIRGAGGFTLDAAIQNDSNRLEVAGANTFTGNIEIRRGSLHLSGIDSLQGNNTLRFNVAAGDSGRFFLRGANRSVKDLSSSGTGSAIIANAPGAKTDGTSAPATLTVTQNNSGVFGGTISDTSKDFSSENGAAGALRLVKQGDATLTLTGANSYTGGTTIAAGTLRIKSADGHGAGGVRLNGGTLSIDPAQGLTRTVFTGVALDLSAGSGGRYTGDFSPLHNTSGNVVPEGTTHAYTGRIFLTAGQWSFGENFDDAAYLKVGSNILLDNAVWGTPTTGSIDIAADGWHDINLRVYNGSGGTGSAGGTWLGKGIGIKTGAASTDGSLYTTFGPGALGIKLKDQLVIANALTVDADSMLEILDTESLGDVRLTGNLSGAGKLTKTGAGRVTLAGLNTRTGATRISEGTLAAGGVNVLGSASSLILDGIAGVALLLDGFDQAIASLAGGGAQGGDISLGGATLTVGGDNTDTSYAGTITGDGGLRKIGTGTLRFDFADARVTSDILSSTAALTLGGGTLEWLGKPGATNTQTLGGVSLLANTRSSLKLTQNGATSLDLRLGDIATASGATLDFRGGTGALAGARFSFTTVNGDPVAANARLGDFASWNGTDWAANSGITDGAGGTFIHAFTGYADIYNGASLGASTVTTSIATGATSDVRIREATAGYADNTLGSGTVTINSLLMSAGGHAATVDMTGRTLVVGDGPNAAGGVAVAAGAKGLTLGTAPNRGTLTAGTSGVSTLGLIANNASAADGLVVNARIADSTTVSGGAGTTGLLVSGGTGGGTVVLAGDNTFTGEIRVVSGAKLHVGAGGATGDLGGSGGVFGAVSLEAGTTLVFNRSDAGLVVANAVSGAGDLVKSGAGTTVLTGANAYSGLTTVSAGTLQIGDGGTAGALGSGRVTNDGALVFNRSDAAGYTVANSVSGTGELRQAGAGTLILTGDNTYSGGTVVTGGGTLRVGSGGTSGTIGSGVVSGTGTLAFNRAGTFTVANGIGGDISLSQRSGGTLVLTGANAYAGATLISAGTMQVGDGGASGTLGSGAVTNNGTLAFNRSDALLTVAAAIGGAGTLRQDGAGTTTLTGANTYAGATLVNKGTLQVGAANGSTGTLGSGEVTVNGTLVLNRSNTLTLSNDVNGFGTIRHDGTGTLVLTGDGTRYAGDIIANSGMLQIGDGGEGGNFVGTRLVTNSMITFNRSASALAVVDISGTGGLTQAGSGTLVLAADNTYQGSTTINANSTLQLGNGGRYGSLGGGGVTNDGTLIFNRSRSNTINYAISGSGSVIQDGSGVTTFLAANNYSGTTTVNAGEIEVAVGATFGAGAVIVNSGGTFRFGSSWRLTLANDWTLNGGTLSASTATLSGTLATGTAGGTIGIGYFSKLTLNGLVTGSGPLKLLGRSTISTTMGAVLFNNAGNTYDGVLTVANGGNTALSVGATTALQYATVDLAPGTASASQVAFAPGVTSATFGGLSGNAFGGISLQTGSTAVTLTVNQSSTTTFVGVLSGTGSLTKAGAGALTLTNANTHTGGTTVSGGTLTLDFSATDAAASNILADSGSVTLTGGTLRIIGKAGQDGVVQTFAGLTSGAGSSTLELVQNAATTLDVNVGALTFGAGAINFVGLTGTTAGARVITTTNAGLNDATTQLSALWNGRDWASVSQVGGAGPNYVVKWAGAYEELLTDSNAANATCNLRINNGAAGTAARYTADTTVGSLLMVATNNQTTVGIEAGRMITVGDSATGNVGIAATGKSLTIGHIAGQGTLTAGNSGAAASLNLSNANAASLLTINAGIANNGAGGVVSLTTAGNVTLNGVLSYTGATTVAAGSTLTLANRLGGGTYAADILNNGTLNLNGAGVQTLSGMLTGTGVTNALSGSLSLGADNALNGGSVILASGVKLELNGKSAGVSEIVLAGVNTLTNSSTTRAAVFKLTLSGDTTITTAAGNDILIGSTAAPVGSLNLAGHTLTLNGAGTLILSGATASGAGDIVINAGILRITDSIAGEQNSTLSGAGTITVNSGAKLDTAHARASSNVSKAIVLDGGSITSGSSHVTYASDILVQSASAITNGDSATFSGVISGNAALTVGGGGTNAFNRESIFNGDSTFTGNLTVTSGTVGIGGAGRLGSGDYTGALAIAAGANFRYGSSANQTLSGAITGRGGLTKWSAGALKLSGNNSFSGGTTINAGTIITANTGALGSGNVTVFRGGILQLGDSGANSGVTLGAGATLALSTDATLKLGATNSRITMSGGNFTLSDGFNLDITGIGIGAGQYTLVTGSGAGSRLGIWSASADLLGGNLSDFSYALARNGGDLVFTVTAIPEPATYGLLGAGALAAAALARRRRRAR